MASNYVEWQLNLFDMRLNRPIADTTGLFTVLTAGTPTAATCYSDAVGTSLTLPATMCPRPGKTHPRMAPTGRKGVSEVAAGTKETAFGARDRRSGVWLKWGPRAVDRQAV